MKHLGFTCKNSPSLKLVTFLGDATPFFFGGGGLLYTFHAEWLSGRLSRIPLSSCVQAFLFRKVFPTAAVLFLLTVKLK